MSAPHVFTPLEREIATALNIAGITTSAVVGRTEVGSSQALADYLGRRTGRQEQRAINRLFNAGVITDIDASGQHWIGGLFLTVRGLESLKHPDPPRITHAQRRVLDPYAEGGLRLIDALKVWTHPRQRPRMVAMIAKLVDAGLLKRDGRAFTDVQVTPLGRLALKKRAHK